MVLVCLRRFCVLEMSDIGGEPRPTVTTTAEDVKADFFHFTHRFPAFVLFLDDLSTLVPRHGAAKALDGASARIGFFPSATPKMYEANLEHSKWMKVLVDRPDLFSGEADQKHRLSFMSALRFTVPQKTVFSSPPSPRTRADSGLYF